MASGYLPSRVGRVSMKNLKGLIIWQRENSNIFDDLIQQEIITGNDKKILQKFLNNEGHLNSEESK